MSTKLRGVVGEQSLMIEYKNLPHLLGKLALYGFTVFAFLLLLAPIMYGFWASFYTDIVATPEFVGLQNYVDALNHRYLMTALRNTVVFTIGTTAGSVGLGLLFALAVNQGLRGGDLARTLILFPYLIPSVVIVFLWQFMLNQNTGIVNEALLALGVIDEGIRFFGTTDWAMPSVVVMSVWVYAAFAFFILLAQLQSVDEALYERATVAGANKWEKFRDITYPTIRGSLLLIVFIRGIWLFNHFDFIFLSTRGGPVNETLVVSILMYDMIFTDFAFAEAAALAVVLFWVLLGFALVYFRLVDTDTEGED